MNKNTNPNLPANAIAVSDVRAGMVILNPRRLDETLLVTEVKRYGFNYVVHTDAYAPIRANGAGTLRLAEED